MHQIAPFFKKNFGVACPRTPLANAWLRHSPSKCSHFSKYILNPPPRNEILDTPLIVDLKTVTYCWLLKYVPFVLEQL